MHVDVCKPVVTQVRERDDLPVLVRDPNLVALAGDQRRDLRPMLLGNAREIRHLVPSRKKDAADRVEIVRASATDHDDEPTAGCGASFLRTPDAACSQDHAYEQAIGRRCGSRSGDPQAADAALTLRACRGSATSRYV